MCRINAFFYVQLVVWETIPCIFRRGQRHLHALLEMTQCLCVAKRMSKSGVVAAASGGRSNKEPGTLTQRALCLWCSNIVSLVFCVTWLNEWPLVHNISCSCRSADREEVEHHVFAVNCVVDTCAVSLITRDATIVNPPLL